MAYLTQEEAYKKADSKVKEIKEGNKSKTKEEGLRIFAESIYIGIEDLIRKKTLKSWTKASKYMATSNAKERLNPPNKEKRYNEYFALSGTILISQTFKEAKQLLLLGQYDIDDPNDSRMEEFKAVLMIVYENSDNMSERIANFETLDLEYNFKQRAM